MWLGLWYNVKGSLAPIVVGVQQGWSVSGRPAVRVSHEKRVMTECCVLFSGTGAGKMGLAKYKTKYKLW